MTDPMTRVEETTRADLAAQERGERAGGVSALSCPLCGGVMWQTEELRLAEFRCHVGHSFVGEALYDELADYIGRGWYSLMRALQERTVLARELAALARGRGEAAGAEQLEAQAREAEGQAKGIRERLSQGPAG